MQKFTKYPSKIVASELIEDFEYPEEINYHYNNRVTYTYVPTYLHEPDPKHNNMEGMYYKVISKNGEPITSEERYYMFGTSEIDVYPDGFVGYIWNGRLNRLGDLNDTAKFEISY